MSAADEGVAVQLIQTRKPVTASRRWAIIGLGGALMLAATGCTAPVEPTPVCPEGFIKWMASADTFGLDQVASADQTTVAEYLPEGVSATCTFEDASAERSAAAIITSTAEEAQTIVDSIHSSLGTNPDFIQSTPIFYTRTDGLTVAIDERPQQFLADMGDRDAGEAIVIVSIDH
ncbi:hypothetical protein ACWPKO_30720 (plasmid) [Coraliomargarita sp. W4R53]